MRFTPVLAALLVCILKAQPGLSRAVSVAARAPFDLFYVEPYIDEEMERRSPNLA
ncbi:hypothetical protein DFH09DRAFT_1339670 [Mycena vulgaris]|nr:hypothetical protein DFH09DRAFT_1339670 [Mycena vulgaris]